MQVSLAEFTAQVEAQLSTKLPSCDERYKAFAEVDPFVDIPSTLLHAGHFASYAIATGMIDPLDPGKLTKPATYAVPLMGECRYLDDDGNQQAFYLTNDPRMKDEKFEIRNRLELRRNSICYITLEPSFRMPAYIAGRFNLLIREVYRGLLVGTGPLVDPGFKGYLSVPIHNFTNNIYTFSAGEDFVYFEFTKLSWSNSANAADFPAWCPAIIHDQPPFPASKQRRRGIGDYLAAATGGLPAQSAIGEEIRKITETSESTRRRLSLFSIASVAAVAALILTALMLAYASYDMFSTARGFVDDAALRQDQANDIRNVLTTVRQMDADVARELLELRGRLSRIEAAVNVRPPRVEEPSNIGPPAND